MSTPTNPTYPPNYPSNPPGSAQQGGGPTNPTYPPNFPSTPPESPGQGSGTPTPTPTPPAAPVFNRLAFIKNYANLVAHTWVDPNYRQQLLTDPVGTLTRAGIPTIPGAEVIIVEHVITGIGQVEDAVKEWLTGNQTGKYVLWLPIAPANFTPPAGGGGPTGGDGPCCCCSPCCCCA